MPEDTTTSAAPSAEPNVDLAAVPAPTPAAEPIPAAREFKKAPRQLELKDAQSDWDRIGDKLKSKEAKPAAEPADKAPKPAAKDKPEPVKAAAKPAAKPAAPAAKSAAKPAPVAAKPAEPAPMSATPAPVADPHAEFKAQAEKLGYKLEGQKVSVKERYGFREEQRKAREALTQRERQLQDEHAKRVAEFDPLAKKYKAFTEAFEAGDFDEAAKAMGHEAWNAMTDDWLVRQNSPEYKRVRDLEQKIKAKEEAEAKARTEWEQRQNMTRQQQLVMQHKQGLAQQAKASADPLLAVLHEDPLFVETLFNLQKKHYDPTSDTTITLEEALDDELTKDGKTLRQVMQAQYDRLHRVFGVLQSGSATLETAADPDDAQASEEPAPAVPVPASRKPVPKQPVSVPRKQSREAASKGGKESDRDSIERWTSQWQL